MGRSNLMRVPFQLIVGGTVLLCGLGSCQSGGSVGTGGHRFEGSVQNRELLGVAGVQVTVLETGDAIITNADGAFALDTALVSGDLQFELRSEQQEVNVTVQGVPAEPSVIVVVFQIDGGDGQIVMPETVSPNQSGGPSDPSAPDPSSPSSSSNSGPGSQEEPSIEDNGSSGPGSLEPSIPDPSSPDPSIPEPSSGNSGSGSSNSGSGSSNSGSGSSGSGSGSEDSSPELPSPSDVELAEVEEPSIFEPSKVS